MVIFFLSRLQIVSRRPGEELLLLAKHRRGHTCEHSFQVVGIVLWDGLDSARADTAYQIISHKVGNFGLPTVNNDDEQMLLNRFFKAWYENGFTHTILS